jgi:hypothetical protein
MILRFLFAHALSILGLVAIAGTVPPAGSAAAENAAATVTVDLQVNGSPLAFSAEGECTFTDQGSIYEKPSLSWSATVKSGTRYVNYANWRLKSSGADMMNLSVMIGNKEHRISTVKVDAQGQPRGSGTSTFAKNGQGGLFTLDAIADSGAKISGRITCSAFGKPEDNG